MIKTADKKTEIQDIDDESHPKLRNWTQISNQVWGEVYDHPRVVDGSHVRTSDIVYINKGIGILQTLNTVYILIDKETKY